MDKASNTPNTSTMAATPANGVPQTRVVWRGKVMHINIARSEVERIHLVDTDFVLVLKSKRRVLLRDAALKATTDEEFAVVFQDERVGGQELFGQAQSQDPSLDAWKDDAAEALTDNASPVAEAVTSPQMPAP